MAMRTRVTTRARRKAGEFGAKCVAAVECGDIVVRNEATKKELIRIYLLWKKYTDAADVAAAGGEAFNRGMETGPRLDALIEEVRRCLDELPDEEAA